MTVFALVAATEVDKSPEKLIVLTPALTFNVVGLIVGIRKRFIKPKTIGLLPPANETDKSF